VNRAWIESATGGRVVARRRLHGGIIARVDEVRVRLASGVVTRFVLRQYEDDPGAVAYEARVLEALVDVALPVPRLVATEGSALLMTKLPGRVNLAPRDMRLHLQRMAAPLPVLHASASLRSVGLKLKMNPRRYDWVRDPGLRRAAEDLVATPPARIARVATHGDYQHFNMLWSRGRMSGIVDWSGIWNGPPEVDVCHGRLNLAVLYGADVADEFRDIYEAEAGRRVDSWHDVHRLGVYSDDWPRFIPIQVHRRASVRRGMTARVEQLLRRALSRD
jgi:aminoglycoside phosphotransferase (APT) family kinase protein